MVLTAVQNSPERWYSTTVGQVSTLIRGLNRGSTLILTGRARKKINTTNYHINQKRLAINQKILSKEVTHLHRYK
jgi:hypothetical protein